MVQNDFNLTNVERADKILDMVPLDFEKRVRVLLEFHDRSFDLFVRLLLR